MAITDKGVLDLWCEWLKERYRQDYDRIVGVIKKHVWSKL